MFEKFEKALMPIADKLNRNKVLTAIRDGFLIATPLLIVGSIFLLIANFPIPNWNEIVGNLLGPDWSSWFKAVSRATFNISGLLTVVGTGYAMSRELKVNKIQGAVLAMVAFFITMPMIHQPVLIEEGVGALEGVDVFAGLSLDFIGPNGIFVALLVAIGSSYLFAFAYKKGWTIKMPKGVPPAVADSFAALVPSALVMVAAFLIQIIFQMTPFDTLQGFIFKILQTPLMGLGDTLGANLIYSFACQVLWFFGINGPAVANSVYFIGNVITPLQQIAFESGVANADLPYIFTNPFSNFFTGWGGGGSTLALVIVMVTFCKSERIKKLGQLSLVPGIFGINEPIIFGLPIVLNPIIIVPFIFVPMINTTISYFLTLNGILPKTTGVSLPWTTPILFSGWLSTGSWRGSAVQLALLILDMVMYFPFIKALDRQYLLEEAEAVDEADEISFDDLSFDDL